ncbi:hypothetical protein VCHA51O444_10760 [Vibrio chagasii]|nr:hypothetical protein VCHA51O444_10760 [Vibrio chagasii]CAH7374679.1 hypothetical protein VCHA53O474_30565 [Vibrio chagasii]
MKTIPESIIDELTHQASDTLRENGVTLDENLLSKLNDNLSNFVVEECGVEIE